MISEDLKNISELLEERVKGGHSMAPSELNALDRQIADLAQRVRHMETTPVRIVSTAVVDPATMEGRTLACHAFREGPYPQLVEPEAAANESSLEPAPGEHGPAARSGSHPENGGAA